MNRLCALLGQSDRIPELHRRSRTRIDLFHERGLQGADLGLGLMSWHSRRTDHESERWLDGALMEAQRRGTDIDRVDQVLVQWPVCRGLQDLHQGEVHRIRGAWRLEE